MAVAEYNYETVLEEIKLLVGDNDNAWMTDTWYKSKIFEHFITNKQTTYSFGLRATGIWTARNDGRKIWFYDMSLTGLDDCIYTVNCNGSIELTTGTDTTDPYTVSGTEVNYPELVCDVCQYLITIMAQKASVNVGAVSYTPQDEARLISIMEIWRGIRAL